jgi:hypothetical protein
MMNCGRPVTQQRCATMPTTSPTDVWVLYKLNCPPTPYLLVLYVRANDLRLRVQVDSYCPIEVLCWLGQRILLLLSSQIPMFVYLYMCISPHLLGGFLHILTYTCNYMLWPLAPRKYNLSIPNSVPSRRD